MESTSLKPREFADRSRSTVNDFSIASSHSPSNAIALNQKRYFEHLAGRFAAKEAVLKVLGTGWRGGIAWTDIEILPEPSGQPRTQLTGECTNRTRSGNRTMADQHQSHRDACDRQRDRYARLSAFVGPPLNDFVLRRHRGRCACCFRRDWRGVPNGLVTGCRAPVGTTTTAAAPTVKPPLDIELARQKAPVSSA